MKELNKQINDIFFKSMHNEQMNSINESIIKEAGAIILKLMEVISDNNKHGNNSEAYIELQITALKWLENHKTK